MAPMARQRANAHDTSCPAQPRQPLTRLTINTRLAVHSYRACKPSSGKPTNPSTMPRNRLRPRLRTRPLDLRPGQVESARAIFEILQSIPHVSNRTPALRPLGDDGRCGQYELEYPAHRLWRLVGDPYLPRLTRNNVRQLRDDLINTISQLYDAHVAYVLDLATFSVAKKLSTHRRGAVFVPFLDTFDFDKHPDNPATSWEDLKNEQLAIVKAHFDVLEVTNPCLFNFFYYRYIVIAFWLDC